MAYLNNLPNRTKLGRYIHMFYRINSTVGTMQMHNVHINTNRLINTIYAEDNA